MPRRRRSAEPVQETNHPSQRIAFTTTPSDQSEELFRVGAVFLLCLLLLGGAAWLAATSPVMSDLALSMYDFLGFGAL